LVLATFSWRHGYHDFDFRGKINAIRIMKISCCSRDMINTTNFFTYLSYQEVSLGALVPSS
jgi:hypothetical protein